MSGWDWPGTDVSWLCLVIALMAALLPLVGSAGIAIGRMQVEDEIKRGER